MKWSAISPKDWPEITKEAIKGQTQSDQGPRFLEQLEKATRRVQQVERHLQGLRRRSSVNGWSGLRGSGATSSRPGVWPMRKKRASRRASASYALTGKVV